MSAGPWVLAGCLAAGALVTAWPTGASTVRHRLSGRRVRPLPGLRAVGDRLVAAALDRPRRTAVAVSAVAAAAGWLAAGPVSALLGGVYAGLAARAVTRTLRGRADAAARTRELDAVGALAADLRAGLTVAGTAPPRPGAAPGGPATDPGPGGTATDPGPGGTATGPGRTAALVAAVWRLAERTGAPAAELLDRIEADARAADRGRVSAAAQAAGARITALLLAVLPVAGIALGHAIGADPLRVLLHTPLGAAAAAAAALLQTVGLVWADRLAGGGAR